MEERILMVLPNNMAYEQCKSIQDKLQIYFPTFQASMQQALKIVSEHVKRGAKFVISRGATAQFLRQNVNITVFDIPYSFFDFAYAIQHALKYASNIAVIGMISEYKMVTRVFDFVVKKNEMAYLNIISGPDEVEGTLRKFAALGVNAFVGGSLVVATAIRLGFHGVLVTADEDEIQNVILKALYNLKVGDEAQKQAEMVQGVFDCMTDGVFAVDQNGAITMANTPAQIYLSKNGAEVIGTNMLDIITDQEAAQMLKDADASAGRLVRCNGYYLSLTLTPIKAGNAIHGSVGVLQDVNRILHLDKEVRNKLLAKGHVAKSTFKNIIGESRNISGCKERARQYAAVDSPVLITGETGVGKELFAQGIHNESRRRENPFIAVNCAAIPSALLESELFGYVRGAFTGAKSEGKIGLFELAHRGTIFLDEIGDVSLELQARLLRVLQEREIVRIGDDKVIHIDVRIIAATNKNLSEEIGKGSFRADLYYRLNVLNLYIPPLRHRKEDIVPMVDNMLGAISQRLNLPAVAIEPQAYILLEQFQYPGNVRQLSNIVERAIVMSAGRVVKYRIIEQIVRESDQDAAVLIPDCCGPKSDESDADINTLKCIERQTIERVLLLCGGNKREAAQKLGISPSTLWRKLNEFKIEY